MGRGNPRRMEKRDGQRRQHQFSSDGLIGAYNGAGADSKSDYFKLKTVSGLTCADNPGGQGCGGGAVRFPSRAPCCWWAWAFWA